MVNSCPSTNMNNWPFHLATMPKGIAIWQPCHAINLYIVIDDHGYDVYHLNGIKDLTDQGIYTTASNKCMKPVL